MNLRPYQTDMINRIVADWHAGYRDVMITAATGSGKTLVFLSLLHQQMQPGQRALILAHRKDLIEQPKTRLAEYYPDMTSVGSVMGDIDEPDQTITIGTVQTLAIDKRLERVLQHGQIDYLVIDECHHAVADSAYAKILRTLRDRNPDLLHVGVTATPIRADGNGLSGIYAKESAHYGIVEMIKTGYLVPVRWLAIQTSINLSGVKTVAGDFQTKQLSDVFEVDNCFDLVVKSHQDYAGDRQAICFTVSVDGAFDLAEKFNAAGIQASAACGKTDRGERQAILDDFSAGHIRVLCNVGLYTEGLDVPSVSCIHMVRPTRSDALYTQCIGRGLRLYPGKPDALILDYAPADVRNIAMAGDVLGVPIRKDAYVKPDAEEGDVAGGFTFDGKFRWMDGNPAEIISRQLDYLEMSPFRWYNVDNTMSLGLGKASDEIERTLVITPPVDGQMTLYLVAKEPGKSWRSYRVMDGDFEKLSTWADDYSAKRGNAVMAVKGKRWQNKSPTEDQIKFAKKLAGCWSRDARFSRGELAQRITHFLALSAIMR